jgi:predicted nuclease of predicted toxin-antitoxin system
MKWLVDAQLSPRLSAWLGNRGEASLHVSEIEGGLRLSDDKLWDYAGKNEYVVMSKDRDFFERSVVSGSPPQVVYLAVGNCSTEKLLDILEQYWNKIQQALVRESPLVVVTQDEIYSF